MAYEQRNGDFVLFRNEKKGDNERAPDYRGHGKDLQGNAVEFAAWIKQGQKGKFMTGSFKVKQQQ